MYELTLENESNKQIVFNQLGGRFTITETTGLSPAKATVNTSSAALLDGEKFNSSKVNMRSINLAFAIEKDAERSRLMAYEVIQPKQPLRIYYKSLYLDVFIDGYVESFNITHFAKKQIGTVSILCPFPYFKGAQEVVNELAAIHSMFHFPFASTAEPQLLFGYIDPLTQIVVENDGMIETGLTFELYARGPVSNPKIYDHETGEYIELNMSLVAGDLVTITTDRGHKTITLLREGVKSNIFNNFTATSTWLMLKPGGSAFVYEVGTGLISNLLVTISHYDLYGGV